MFNKLFKIITRKPAVPHTLFWPLVLSFTVLVSGCASVADKTENAPASANANKQAAEISNSAKETSASHKSAAENIPGTELDSKLLYDLLLAEMALQRNDYDLAFKKYYEAAKKTRDSRLARKATRVTLFSKNDDQTFKAVKLWSELQPDNIDVLQIYASSLINRKQDQEALRYLKKIIARSDSFDAGFQRAVGLLDTIKEPVRLTSLFAELAKGHEDRAIVKLNQAKLSFKLGDNAGAERHLNEALAINPDYLEASMLKIQLLKKQHRPQEAIALLEKLLKKQPDNINLRLELVRMLVAQKQVKKADRQIKRLASMDINPEVIFAISLLAIEINQLDDAKKYLERLYKYRLYASEAAYFIAQLEASRENYAEAETWFKRVKQGRYTFEAYLGLAIVYSQQEKFDQAFKLLEHSQAGNSKQSLEILQIKAEVYAQAKNYKKAYEIYTQALKIAPNNHDLLYGRAMLAEKFGRIDLLEKDLHTILAENPKDNQALNALGYTLADRTDRYQEALQYIERALKIAPEDIATLDSMGWVLHKLGRNEEALSYLKKAYDKDHDPEIAAHYGEVLWLLGKTEQARAVWHKALKKHPQHEVLVGTTRRYLK